MQKRFWIIITVLIVGFFGVILLTGNKNKPTAVGATNGAKPSVFVTGKADSTVTLTEYGDFQCSACKLFYPVVEEVVAKYGDRVRFEFRQYPLTTIHENAFAAARAAEAAGKQDKFWEMYRMLYTNQDTWSRTSRANTIFEDYARQLGLDMSRYKIDFASAATNNIINASIAEFNARGLAKSTPTFLLNGKKVQPESTVKAFSTLLDDALASSN